MPKEKKLFSDYLYAVLTVDRAEGNAEVGTQWQDTHLIPLNMPLRKAITELFGDPVEWPKGRVTLTVPEVLPFTPEEH